MKKIIASILALACGLCAYAKTLDELVAGMPAIDESVKGRWEQRVEYVNANYADFAREFAAYLASDFATKNQADITDEQRKIRSALTPFYAHYGDKFNVSDAAGIRLSVPAFYKWTGAAKYQSIKAAGWKIGGVAIPPNLVFSYAVRAKDKDYIASITLKQARETGVLAQWAELKIDSLFEAKDRVAALDEATEIEMALLAMKNRTPAVNKALERVKELNEGLYINVLHKNKLK